MASCTTPTFGNASTCPRITLEVNISSNTDTASTLSWSLKYYSKTAAQTSVSKSYTAVIAGQTVASGTYNINGKTGTHVIKTGTKSINKTTSEQNISFSCSMAFNLTWSGVYGGTKSASGSIKVPAKAKFTISYNANGGTGAPASQSAYAGQSIVLSSAEPTREGAKFKGWDTDSSRSEPRYQPGKSYTFTTNTTLYAIWETNDYTISYDANGGTGAPASQIKKYGTSITLSSQKPTRENYNFMGWGLSRAAISPDYQPGDVYSDNASITLYAVWQLGYTAPRITNLTADRCDSNGNQDEEGKFAKVKFNWEVDDYANSIKIEWKSPTESYWNSKSVSPGYNNKGSVNERIGNGDFDTETEYNVRVTVRDSNGEGQAETEVSSIAFELDFLGGGGGVSIGKPATKKGFEVNYPATFENTVVDQYGANMIAGLAKEGTSEDPNTTLEHSIVTSLNTPNNEKMYVVTYFHGRKSTNDNRMQCAYPYSGEDTEYVRHYEGGSWTSWKKVGGSTLTQEHFLTLENHKNVITVGNLRGGYIKNIHGVRYGNVVNLYFQINDITSGGSDVEIFRFKNSRYYPAMYGVHNGFISKENNVCYIGQFNDGHFTMNIFGGGTINSSNRAMVLITMTYLTN